MRPVPEVDGATSIQVATLRLAESGVGMVAVTREGRFIGIVSDKELMHAYGEAVDRNSAVIEIARDTPTIKPYESAAQAVRMLDQERFGAIVVVDDDNRPVGLLNAACFWGLNLDPPRPGMVGGMATPLGVYLTTGSIRSGANPWALALTGATMFVIFLAGRLMVIGGLELLEKRGVLVPDSALGAFDIIPLAFLLLAFRLSPISGIHAAEHQVVHAIERDEPLALEIVKRMPRVHPRCGTNIAVGATLFLLIAETPWIPLADLRLLVAIIVAAFFWRPVGNWVQNFLTTRPASDKQLLNGIAAGEELLMAYATGRLSRPSPLVRLINSGILHVISGSFAAYGIFYLLATLLGFDASKV